MCGIAGFLDPGAGLPRAELESRAARMADPIAHRGPDGSGVWADAASGVAFSHRRLAILELSERGAQPMRSRPGRYTITFNGEIYNFRELRGELERLGGHRFDGGSDTEVMLAAFEQWGVEASLKRFDGMFAFAAWDARDRALWLARDKLGEKPLYYGWSGGTLLFGSELKALKAHPAWRGRVDRSALASYFRYGCIPAPYSVYERISKLAPGCSVRFEAGGSVGEQPEPRAYWSLGSVARAAQARPFGGDFREACAEVDRRLGRAVAQRTVSDVPVGAFLSGGIDSSLIVAQLQKAGGRARTFTIGFEERDYDEAAHAALIARHLGTDHTEARLSASDALGRVPELSRFYDEPFADSSQIATMLVAAHARKHVKVCLSGDAGDEFFAGYHRHFWGARIWSAMSGVPAMARELAAALLRPVPEPVWAGVGGALGRRPAIFATQARKLIDVLSSRDAGDLYLRLVSHSRDPGQVVLGAEERSTRATTGRSEGLWSRLAEFQYLDAMTYLPDDILTKVDRATMAVGLEARVPFLAPDVIELAWSLPDAYKVEGTTGKRVLREVLKRYLPDKLILGPKSGFAVPVASWLRGELRGWAEGLLSEHELRAQGYLDATHVRELWDAHQAGRDKSAELWDVLMFQSWLQGETAS